MHRYPQRALYRLALSLLTLFLLAGCASHARQVLFQYQTASPARTKGGDLYLINTADKIRPPAGIWELGSTRNPEGLIVDSLLSGTSPAVMAQDALQLELGQSGYRILSPPAVPPVPARLVEISEASVRLEQTTSLTKVNAACTIKLSLRVIKDGERTRTFHYEAKGSDLAIKDRERLAEAILLDTMQEVMKQAIPDIVGVMEN